MANDTEIFISYAWGGESENLVEQLDREFQAKGITIIRDKRDLGFKGRIKEFMERIGRGNAVILVISEKYLKSENCMFELVQIIQNGQFYDRIFPIVLNDANIYKPIQRIKYVQYWEEEIIKLDEAMKTVGAANLQGFREDIDLYTKIRATIAELTNILKDMNTLTPSIHIESDFKALFEAVETKLSESLHTLGYNAIQPALAKTEPVQDPIKYYLYISETKIDMLFPQVSHSFLTEVAAKFKIDLGLITANLDTSDPRFKGMLYAKTNIVTQYIRSYGDVGTVVEPKRYISGTHALRWGVLSDYASDLAFFGGVVGNTMLALIGSSASLIGRKSLNGTDREEWHSVDYYNLKWLNGGLHNVDMSPTVDSSLDSLPEDFKAFATSMSKHKRLQNIEFLAKKLSIQKHKRKTLVVATPIYVSLED